MEDLLMEETMKGMGIETSLLNSKLVFTRNEAVRIFNCTYPTLKSFEKRNWIKAQRFKNRNYYTKAAILECITLQTEVKNHSD